MAADETRLLVLGAVVLFEPLNGYQLRRELLSWGVEEWAHIKPGSIYSMLTTLTRDHLVERFDVSENGAKARAVSVYVSTPSGRDRFREMVSDELRTARSMRPVSFHLALNFSVLLPRREVIDCLRARLAAAEQSPQRFAIGDRPSYDVPPHVIPTLDLRHRVTEVEVAWLREHIARLEAGELSFDGEPPDPWEPGPDDGGWQIVDDRARYLEFIDARRAADSDRGDQTDH